MPVEQRRFAHGLIELANVDVVHGHSSHHVKGIEVYRDRLILYGCGDFLTDYEGISGYEEFRGDSGAYVLCKRRLIIWPSRWPPDDTATSSSMRLCRTSASDVAWLHRVLNRECERLRARVRLAENGSLTLQWDQKCPKT